ncbi:MAG: hypothetical protein HYS26_03670 [Candidatus Kaiserbacteria bacterium]|nr:MAG: hypothetical protein HYS26_03670 [Candidatus Kaiserbacteria bacterium]
MKKAYGSAAAALLTALVLPLLASADSQITITPSGEFLGKNLTILQKSGGNLFTRAIWGNAFIRVTVLVGTSTMITKNYGERATTADILEKHVIDVEGKLASGADSIMVNATKIRDIALIKESKKISGTVKSVNATERSIVVPNSVFGETSVVISASVSIKKGARQIEFGEIAVGDRVVSIAGVYDYESQKLQAQEVEIYQDTSRFKPKNFQGTLKSISGTTLPITVVVAVDGTDYTVYLNAKAFVLSKSKAATSLKRFAEGDMVRFWGAIRPTNFSEIDAEIIRDLNF